MKPSPTMEKTIRGPVLSHEANRARAAFRQTSRKGSTDYATIFGLLGAFSLIAAALILGGSPQSFLNGPAFLIVIGGTFATTMICFSVPEVLGTQRVLMKTIFSPAKNASDAAFDILHFADQTRKKKGVIHMQDALRRLRNEPFLHNALAMAVDSMPAEEIEQILRRDLDATLARHIKSASVLRKAAEVAPAMGLIGTLVGLVQMLGNLNDPSAIGPGMAVALLTTFYGAILANLVFAPLASKLERNSHEEALVNQIYLMGAASVGRQENPRRLEIQLNSVLPPEKRVKFFK